MQIYKIQPNDLPDFFVEATNMKDACALADQILGHGVFAVSLMPWAVSRGRLFTT